MQGLCMKDSKVHPPGGYEAYRDVREGWNNARATG